MFEFYQKFYWYFRLKQAASRPNHTSYKKFYLYEFVANVLHDNVGMTIFDHWGCGGFSIHMVDSLTGPIRRLLRHHSSNQHLLLVSSARNLVMLLQHLLKKRKNILVLSNNFDTDFNLKNRCFTNDQKKRNKIYDFMCIILSSSTNCLEIQEKVKA